MSDKKKQDKVVDISKPILISDTEAMTLENKLLKLEIQQMKKEQFEKEYREFMEKYQTDINATNKQINELVEKYDIPDGFKFEPAVKGFVYNETKQQN